MPSRFPRCLRTTVLGAALAVVACSGGGSGAGANGGHGGMGAGGAPACTASLFQANAQTWPLPAGPNFSYAGGLALSTGCPAYATGDLDGDGKPDLVVTSDCDATAGVGSDHWLVYRNTGSGFSASATTWALPAKSGFSFTGGLAATYSCPIYATTDMNADGKPDLVVTSDCDSTSGVGADHWLVYLNTGAGFSATATSWALPASAAFSFITGTSAVHGCPEYATTDMNGDGKPDLVITWDCGNTGVATDHWLVYLNTGAGFSAAATSWALPQAAGYLFKDGLSASYNCPDYALSDFDGDGKPELVITYDCGNGINVGLDHWLVHANTGSGFAATPLSWALPAGPGYVFKNGLAAATGCPTYGVADFDGDRKPELVITGDCGNTAGVGLDHWLVYRNMGAGFTGTTVSWSLPANAAWAFQAGLASSDGCPGYATSDLDGDHVPDLVLTSDCGDAASLGLDHWLVYRGGCQ